MYPLPHTTLAILLAMLWCCAPTATHAQTARLNDRYGVEGFSQPVRLSKVAGKTSGVIVSRNVREGEFVTEGTVLATLDQTVHERRLELARLAMESQGEAEAAIVEERMQQMRFQAISDLANRGHATEVELRQAETDFLASKAAVMRVKERQAQLKADYDRHLAEFEQCQIRAPFDGVVVDFQHEVGEYVGPGEPHVCTVAQLSKLSVEFLLPRSLRDSVHLERQVKVHFTLDNVIVDGQVTYISPIPNGETNVYVVKVEVDNRDGKLSAGERCLLDLDDWSRHSQDDKHVSH